jgi:hypothetical protein
MAARSSGVAPGFDALRKAERVRIGTRMSGLESCAITEPSTNSTSEWTMLCAWIRTSMRSAGTSNSQAASMTSRPLFIMVAESTEILRPSPSSGCAQARRA